MPVMPVCDATVINLSNTERHELVWQCKTTYETCNTDENDNHFIKRLYVDLSFNLKFLLHSCSLQLIFPNIEEVNVKSTPV